ELLAGLRAARLDQQRLAGGRPLHVERPAYLKVLSLVLERMHLGAIDEDTRLPVAHDGAFVPAMPQPADNVDELARNLVALVVLDMGLAAEIAIGFRRTGRDDVPGHATFGEVGQRLEHARDVERLAETRRDRAAETDLARDEA